MRRGEIWQSILFFLVAVLILVMGLVAISNSLPIRSQRMGPPTGTTTSNVINSGNPAIPSMYIPAPSRPEVQKGDVQQPLCYERFSEQIHPDQTSVFRYRPVYTLEQARETSGRNEDTQLPFCYHISRTVTNPLTGEPSAKPIYDQQILAQYANDHTPAEFSIPSDSNLTASTASTASVFPSASANPPTS